MDKSKTIMDNFMAPAQLFIGSPIAVEAAVHAHIQQHFCKKNGCGTCTICTQITQHQFHSLLWFSPENSYTREQLEPLFYTISFQLEPNQQFFYVITHADALTLSCANSLLKSLEEPPRGYHFILTTDRPNDILPTIRSRCMHITINTTIEDPIYIELFKELSSPEYDDSTQFLKLLEQSAITERETMTMLDQLLELWVQEYKKMILEKNNQKVLSLASCIQTVRSALSLAPMPGSSKLLLKNLYLQIKLHS